MIRIVELVLNVQMDITLIGISYCKVLRLHCQQTFIIIKNSIHFVVNVMQVVLCVHHNTLVLNACLVTFGINQHLQQILNPLRFTQMLKPMLLVNVLLVLRIVQLVQLQMLVLLAIQISHQTLIQLMVIVYALHLLPNLIKHV